MERAMKPSACQGRAGRTGWVRPRRPDEVRVVRRRGGTVLVALVAILLGSCTGSEEPARPSGSAASAGASVDGPSSQPGSGDTQTAKGDPACEIAHLIEADVVLGFVPGAPRLTKDATAHRCIQGPGPNNEVGVLLYRPASARAVLDEARSEGAPIEGVPDEAYLVGSHVVAVIDERVFGFSVRIGGRDTADAAVRAAAWALYAHRNRPDYVRGGEALRGRCVNFLQPTRAASVLGGPVDVQVVDRPTEVCRFVGGLEEGSLIRLRLIHGERGDEVFRLARETGRRTPMQGFRAFRVGDRVFVALSDGVYCVAVFFGGEPDGAAAARVIDGILPYWL